MLLVKVHQPGEDEETEAKSELIFNQQNNEEKLEEENQKTVKFLFCFQIIGKVQAFSFCSSSQVNQRRSIIIVVLA